MASAIGLAFTNPSPAEFEAFAGERLADLAVQELCFDDGLPMLLRLVLRNCSDLIGSQRLVFGRLVRSQSVRVNAGLFSLYRTELGGQRIWADWKLPRYGVLTLAVAGQFVVLRTTERVERAAQADERQGES
ncbi:MAG: DUF4359 domain-containing protein [Prochlorococcaceae cyanobacterium]